MQLRDSLTFQKDLRRKLNSFVDENPGESTRTEIVSNHERKEKEMAFYNDFVRTNLEKGNVWSWHAIKTTFDATSQVQDSGFHWAYYLRNSVMNLISKDSTAWQSYCDYLLTLNIGEHHMPTVMSKLSQKAHAAEQARKEKEEKLRLEEEEKLKKNTKQTKPTLTKTDATKKTTVNLALDKREHPDDSTKIPKNFDRSNLEQAKSFVMSEPSPRRKLRPPVQTEQWKQFEIIHKQIEELPLSSVTAGVVLEAYVDEIEARLAGDLPIHFPVKEEKEEAQLAHVLDSIFSQLLSSK